MTSFEKHLKKDAAWQKERSALSWAEKVRLAEALRESIAQIRRNRPGANRDARTAPKR